MTNTTRRQFLATTAAMPLVSPILLGMQDKAGTKKPVLGEGAYTLRSDSRLGRAAAADQVGQHARRRRGLAGQHLTSTTPCTRPATAPTRSSSSIAKGKFVRSWGKEFRGVAHGLHIRKEGERRVPLPDRQRGQPEDDAAAGDAGRGREDDAEGRDRLEDPGAAGRATATGPAPTARRRATTRPTSRSRRTATSTSATATARPTSTSTTRRASTSAPSAAADRSRGSWPSRTASGSTRAARRRSWSSPIAATTGCSASRSTASTSTSSRDSGCPATSTSTRAWS